MKKLSMIAVSALFASTLAFAGTTPFQIVDRTSSLNPANPVENAILESLNLSANGIESVVNTGFLNEDNRTKFAQGISRANLAPTSSLLFAREHNPAKYSLGAGLQAGLYSEDGSRGTSANNGLPALGLGAHGAFNLSIRGDQFNTSRIAFMEAQRFSLSLSGMVFSTKVSSVSVNMLNFGVNGQYKLVTPVGTPYLLGWGGIDFGTGLNFAKNTATYSAHLTQSFDMPISGTSNTAAVKADVDYELGIKSTTFYVPFEFSSNVTLFYLFTLYGGGGLDLNFGSSKMTGTSSGPVTATTDAAVATSNLFSGNAVTNLDDGISASPSFVSTRGFIGLQANLWYLRVGADVTVHDNSATNFALYARFSY